MDYVFNKEDVVNHPKHYTSDPSGTSFCARLYGLRRNKRRTEKLIEELQQVRG